MQGKSTVNTAYRKRWGREVRATEKDRMGEKEMKETNRERDTTLSRERGGYSSQFVEIRIKSFASSPPI